MLKKLRLIFAALMLVVIGTGPVAALEITMSYPHSSAKAVPGAAPLFGHYLATGYGKISGEIEGDLSWDLYEDQSSDDFHPAHFIGALTRDGRSISVQLIGLYTPVRSDSRTDWKLIGSLSIDDADLLPAKQVPVVGTINMPTRKAIFRTLEH